MVALRIQADFSEVAQAKGVVKQEADRLPSIAFAPILAFANGDPEHARLRGVVETPDSAHADKLAISLDAEIGAVLIVLNHMLLEPLLPSLQRSRAWWIASPQQLYSTSWLNRQRIAMSAFENALSVIRAPFSMLVSLSFVSRSSDTQCRSREVPLLFRSNTAI